jgi:hypothetical protein
MHTDVDTPPIKPIQTDPSAKALKWAHSGRMRIHREHRCVKAPGEHLGFHVMGIRLIPQVKKFFGIFA